MKKILLIAAALVIATVGGCSKDSGSGSDYTAASTASTASDGSTVTIAASGESSNDEKPDQTDNSGSNGNDYYNDMPNETSTDGTTGKVSGTSKVQTVTEAKADTSVSDSGVTITKPTTITKDGTYIVTGKINGQIYVTAKDVTLILNGAEITNSGAPAILGEYGNGKQTLTITLKGTNIINGGTHGIQGKDKLVINGEGAVSVSAVKDGLHGGASLKIDGGNIDIIKSYEGMESPKITLNNGNVRIYADDDGMNAATDDKTVVPEIIINGGYLELYSNSDGIDSNGTITIAGGVVAVFNYAPRDGDSTYIDSGGTILPSLYGTGNMAAGDVIEVGGYSWTLAHQADKFFICVPNLVSGQSYTVNKNGVAFATGNATTEIEGMMMGGNGGGGGMKPPGGGGGRR